jgi:predicted RNA-binding protein with PUA-like domain
MKTEPDELSIDDLQREGTTCWDGVRSFQARNFLRRMRVGDLVLFYHSSTDPPGVVGVARICGEARPDPTALDSESPYFDPKSAPDRPRWDLVEVEFVRRLPRPVPLSVLKSDRKLAGMRVRARGQRLSVQPVAPRHFRRVLELGGGIRSGAPR